MRWIAGDRTFLGVCLLAIIGMLIWQATQPTPKWRYVDCHNTTFGQDEFEYKTCDIHTGTPVAGLPAKCPTLNDPDPGPIKGGKLEFAECAAFPKRDHSP
jgi:hypothetical protein